MSFQAPLFLLGLAVVPIAIVALLLARRRPSRYVIRFPATATLAAVAPRHGRVRKHLPPALLMLALAGMAVALARPEATVAVPVERASVMLVTDTSGSMNATDVTPNRLTAAKQAADRFLDRVPDQLQVGLVAFADSAHTVLRPTQDRTVVKSTLDGLQAEGGTATGDALTSALQALETGKDKPPAAIVLLSDGASKTGQDPAAVAQQARAANVPIYTVALGTSDGVIETMGQRLSVPPDPEALQQVADISGGRAFTAEDSGALDEVYETLGSRIGTKQEKREVSAGFAAFGLLALAGAAFTSLRWRGRLP
ncbi:Ca-activated chloride channel family protein [Solirubrobacter pauli]|uniref:Ca-activated chloride channel family protein n=1 Tax=Solirubrobacter pauli TaxID=166793 RepID=A0A660L9M5_9ACTN|nr:VWA domain-containing protein [Solirubrobacter pauli]RKQ90965.1 Ca-activated chloride channel family protein [Solirubrobacter pauli]